VDNFWYDFIGISILVLGIGFWITGVILGISVNI